jgi:hypothetical protein
MTATTRSKQMVISDHQMHRAARRIQKTMRGKVRIVNDTDPITLEVLPRNPFVLVQCNGVSYGYDAVALATFFETSATWNDPFTNTRLNIVEVRRLENFVRREHNMPACLVSAYLNPNFKSNEKFLEQAFDDLDDICGNLLVDILLRVDNESCTCREFQDIAGDKFYPLFNDFFGQMMSFNEDNALKAILKYLVIAKGDPRHLRHVNGSRKWMHVMDFLFAKVIEHMM